MKRIIKIEGRTGRFDVPSFLWTENETLTVQFQIQESRRGKYVVVAICGDQKKTVYLDKDLSFTLTSEWLKAGNYQPVTILLEFRTINRNAVIVPNDPEKGGYFIEPLYIERVEENTTAIAWLQMVASEIQSLNNRIEKAENRLKEFEDDGVPLLFEDEETQPQNE